MNELSCAEKFRNTIVEQIESINRVSYVPKEEKDRVKFHIKEVLENCGVPTMCLKVVCSNGFTSILVNLPDNEFDILFNQRRQSTWKEYDAVSSLHVEDAICIAEKHIYNGVPYYTCRWDSIITGGNIFSFTGKIRSWEHEEGPICDRENDVHLSPEAKKLLKVKSVYGCSVREGTIHSKVWSLPDGRIQGYDEWTLSTLLKREGFSLVAISITKDTYMYGDIADLVLTDMERERLTPTYLLAEAIACKKEEEPDGHTYNQYAVFSFMSRYDGTPKQRELLENTTASDLILRCSFMPWKEGERELSYYYPLWTAAIIDNQVIYLSGNRLDYALISKESSNLLADEEGLRENRRSVVRDGIFDAQ